MKSIPTMTNQEIADECAMAMGWRRDTERWDYNEWIKPDGSREAYYDWTPWEDYNQCRMMEDFLFEKGHWLPYSTQLGCHGDWRCLALRSTALERCCAFLEVMREKAKEK